MLIGRSPIAELPWQVVAGVVIFTTTMIYWARRRTPGTGTRPRVGDAARRATILHRRDTENDLRDLMLEVEKLTREATAQIETRYRKLEAVLRDADRRIHELRQLTGTSVDSSVPARGLDITIGEDGVTQAVDGAAPQHAVAQPSPATETVDRRAAVYDRVCALADNRLPPREIAARVDRPVGEVELMLGLRAQRIAAGQ